MRNLTWTDRWLTQVDQGLRVSLAPAAESLRPSPAVGLEDCVPSESERRHAAGLMRINHTGEVCAQALYAGQAVASHSPALRSEMERAAREEVDHLAWCAARLEQLGSRPSLFNPVWYAGSFLIGAAAGLAGDRWSLGFVEATERQVEAHLHDHLERLPASDQRSRAIIEQMKLDEARHAQTAAEAGARILPAPIQRVMAVVAGLMKRVAYRV